MVPYIARQSVIIKCNMQKAGLLGNYEFYYAAGLFKKFYGAELEGEMLPQEAMDAILKQIGRASPKDKREEYLINMLKNYEPGDEHNAETQIMFSWGEKEEQPWEIK